MAFTGFSAVQKRSEDRALAKRAEIRRSRPSSSSPDRTKYRSTPSYADYSSYGSSSLPGTSKQVRADGSTVYFRDGLVVREVSKDGTRIVRVGVSKTTPSSSGKISRISAPVMLQQRYKEALDKYNKTLMRVERDRQAELRKEAFGRGIRETTYAGLGASLIFDKAAIDRLKGPYSASFKSRQKNLLDKQLAFKIQENKKLRFKLGQVNAFAKMSSKELKQLEKITKKVSRVERVRKDVSARHTKIVRKITGKDSASGTYLGRAARNLPAQAFAMFFNLAPSCIIYH